MREEDKEKTAHARQEKHAAQYVNHRTYDAEAHVWLHQHRVPRGKFKALSPRWTGPYVVERRASEVIINYAISRLGARKSTIVHYNRLKPYRARPSHLSPPPPARTSPPPSSPTSPPVCVTPSSDDSDVEWVTAPPPAPPSVPDRPHRRRRLDAYETDLRSSSSETYS